MGDQQQIQMQMQMQEQAGVAPPRAKKSVVSKMAGVVANHSYMSLAVIVVLTIVVIGTYIYYRGFLFLGPYAKPCKGSAGAKPGKGAKSKAGADDEAPAPLEKGDAETERLINSINSN